MRTYASSNTTSMRSGSVTKYGERYPRSTCCPPTPSRTVSADLDSSTVMTPSLPTFSIASAIRLPIVLSLCEAIVATWAISFLSFVDLESFFSSSVTASTAAAMPRLSPIGLAPAVTLRSPSRKIACASTVAVVVPSPAMSEVFEAASFSICAPMSSLGSLSSISLATVTPSLVIVGLPNFLSMTTLRPFGPSVALTAAAMMLMPLSRLARASSSNFSCFAIAHVPPYSRMARTSSSRMIRYSLSSSFTSEPEYFPKRILSPALTSSGTFLPSSVTLPLPTAMTLPSWGFSFAVSGMMIPPFLTSFSSSRSTSRRSCKGRIFISPLPRLLLGIEQPEPGVRPGRPSTLIVDAWGRSVSAPTHRPQGPDGLSRGDLVPGRVRNLRRLNLRSSLNHFRHRLQHVWIGSATVRLRVLFLLPQTDCDRFLAVVRWEERDFVPEALLLAKQGDDFLLDHRSKLRNAVGLQLHANGSGKHVNLPQQLRLRRVQITCLRSDDLKK